MMAAILYNVAGAHLSSSAHKVSHQSVDQHTSSQRLVRTESMLNHGDRSMFMLTRSSGQIDDMLAGGSGQPLPDRSNRAVLVTSPHQHLHFGRRAHKKMTMPLVGYGTCGKCQGLALDKAFATFLDAGGRMFDTATMYGNHAQLGNVIKHSGLQRRELFIIDKIDPHTIFKPEDVMHQIDTALDALHTGYLDLLLIHGPWGHLGSIEHGRESLWRTMIRARALGKVKHIGVSNYNRTMIEALVDATGERPAANEFEYHPWVRPHVKELAAWCRSAGIQVIAYGSLGTGGFSRMYPSAVEEAANSHHASPSDVLLRWALDQDVAVIPSSGNADHIRRNLLVDSPTKTFNLSLEEKIAIEASPRPQGWRRCTLLDGCFKVDTNDAED